MSKPIPRAPVVVVMGHIDHGKSSLLDYIRKTKVTEGEVGGITQRASAYEVKLPGKERAITFIDTPGHDAFTGIRARGAAIADIAILVVAAEDGVKPQTVEAWQAIEANHLPAIIAINKIDKPEASIDRAKQSLAENNIFVEGYGGKIPFTAISAKTGQGISDLLELVDLQADLLELTGDPEAPASGVILETSLDPRAGISATLIIKNGTLRGHDFLVTSQEVFRLKRLTDFLGKPASSLTFSSPAMVIGFTQTPEVGRAFFAFADKKLAEAKWEEWQTAKEESKNLVDAATEKEVTIPLVIKADVAGSLEALEKELGKINDDKVGLKIIGRGTGQITENDAKLASASRDSLILGFHTKTERAATTLAEKVGLTIQNFDIIYKLSEWLAEEVKRRRPKVVSEKVMGQAKLLRLFNQDRGKQVIGGNVLEGTVGLGQNFRIIRRGAEIGRGKITNLEQQRSKVKAVEAGNQFGAMVETKNTLAVGDLLETIELVEE